MTSQISVGMGCQSQNSAEQESAGKQDVEAALKSGWDNGCPPTFPACARHDAVLDAKEGYQSNVDQKRQRRRSMWNVDRRRKDSSQRERDTIYRGYEKRHVGAKPDGQRSESSQHGDPPG